MWPQALQMTRDECRGILRRLELESYSHVISVFRAQGGLSENKAKLLEELRSIFHITQERHRAEARRVANDEQLSTIAEAISGPNTWQEWSREGRRSFPMLPRVAPQTALALIANSVAAETAAENSKLPYPGETADALAIEQAAHVEHSAKTTANYDTERMRWNIVSSDPFKVPDIPTVPKKTLKRNMPDSQNSNIKRRSIIEVSPSKNQQQHQYQQKQQNVTDAVGTGVLTTSSNIKKLYHNHSKIQQQQQQQKAYQQQMQKQKSAARRSTGGQTKRQAAAKGRRTQIAKEQEYQQQQQQQQEDQQQQYQQQSLQSSPLTSHHLQDLQKQHQQQVSAYTLTQSPIDMQLEPIEDSKEATIVASKKDISKNLTKVHTPTTNVAATSSSLRLQSHDTTTSSGSSSSAILHGSKTEKQLISTPVQKYIVEDRQSPAATLVQSTSTSPQIMTIPQLSAAASKLRTMNTTILPPGTKLTATKKLPTSLVGASTSVAADNASNQAQVFNIIEGTTITTTSLTGAAHPPSTPTHTPPAVIQLNSSSSSADLTLVPQPAQGKVLTTKLMPIVLSSSSAGKIESLNNGATIVNAGSGGTNPSANSSIFKTLPSTLLVSTAGGSNTLTLSTSLASGAHTVFRKQPNIIKAGIIGMGAGVGTAAGKLSTTYNASGASGSSSSSGPQIISNIKLSPAVVTSSSATSAATQQFLKSVSTSGIRTSVKICQSPNGKMFIQPANADALKTSKLPTSLQHKLLPTQFSATSSGGVSSATTPQRIAIQKVQIIPAPMSSPGSIIGTMQQQPQQKPTSSLTISNKANMIFMPTTCARGTATISISKGGNISNIAQPKTQMPQHDVSKQNVFVIGAVAQQQGLKSTSRAENNTNQMITEDTPVDILNIPMIVDNSNTPGNKTVTTPTTPVLASGGSNIGDTVTVISNEILETTNPESSAVVLGVTDWEMELDQATAVAAASKAARTQRRSTAISIAKSRKSTEQQQQQQQDNTIIVDDNFDDVIVEETFIDEGTEIEDEDYSTENSCDANVDFIMVAAKDNLAPDQQQQIDNQQSLSSSQQKHEDDMQIEVVDEDQLKHKEAENRKISITTQVRTPHEEIETNLQSVEDKLAAVHDETMATEIDENTAIEYIEEDHNDEGIRTNFKANVEVCSKLEIKQTPEDANRAACKDLERILIGDKNSDITFDVGQRNLSNPNSCVMESIIGLEKCTEAEIATEEVADKSFFHGED